MYITTYNNICFPMHFGMKIVLCAINISKANKV